MFKKNASFVLIALLPFAVFAQGVTYNQVTESKKNIENKIKGTLDGVVQTPQAIHQRARQHVFPNSNSLNQGYSNNPWSNAKPQQATRPNYGGLPKGNPWAPVGAPQQFTPRNNNQAFENNPYTDAMNNPQPSQPPMNAFSNDPFRTYQRQASPFDYGNNNGFYDNSNGSFSMPFGDNFFPSNNFWPDSNNGSSSMPFMPW